MQRPVSGRAGVKQAHHFSALRRRQSENGQIDAGVNSLVGLTNPRCGSPRIKQQI
jgi:hypothetical protein